MTVRGPIPPGEMGPTLPHEHVLVDFVGRQGRLPRPIRRRRGLPDRAAPPERIRDQGIRTLVDCTPAYLGRDPALLRRLSEASGLNILTPTGYYGAGRGKFLPDHARAESADELASRWLREWREGIEGTGIRPGFIKLGADAGPLPEVHRKLVRAAARTHLASGLTIAAHSGDGVAALEALEILRKEGLDGPAFIWVHANAEADRRLHARAAEAGAWVEFDGIGPKEVGRHVDLVRSMKEAGQLGRVLLSHDAGWYHVGEPGGGEYPALRHADGRLRAGPAGGRAVRGRGPPIDRGQSSGRVRGAGAGCTLRRVIPFSTSPNLTARAAAGGPPRSCSASRPPARP